MRVEKKKLNWDFLENPTPKQKQLINKRLGLASFIPRKNNEPFTSLSEDEVIIANYGFLWKELLKSCLESFYGCQLDNIMLDKQLYGESKDQKGGINYYNYMFSDRYDDEDRKTDRPLGPGLENYAILSIREALEKYWKTAEGWEDCVMMMGFWFEKNIHTYQLGKEDPSGGPCNLFPEPYENHIVRDDCTGYVTACLLFYTAIMIYPEDENKSDDIFKAFSWPPSSEAFAAANGGAQETVKLIGFEIIPYSPDELQPFDIIVGNSKYGKCQGHHGEIYAGTFGGRKRSWGWGGVHDESKGGMPAGFVNYNYDWIFRLEGITKYTDQEAEEMIEEARSAFSIPDGSDFYKGKSVGSNNIDSSQNAG